MRCASVTSKPHNIWQQWNIFWIIFEDPHIIGYYSKVMNRSQSLGILMQVGVAILLIKSPLQVICFRLMLQLSLGRAKTILYCSVYSGIGICSINRSCTTSSFPKVTQSRIFTGQAETLMIYKDNQSTIVSTKYPLFYWTVKHINIKYHFIQEQVSDDNNKLKYCQTSNMVTDIVSMRNWERKIE